MLSGGRYPSDPVRGSIAGRYISAGLRFRLQSAPPRVNAPLPVRHSSSNGDPDDPPAATQLTVNRRSSDAVKLVLHAPPATLIEIAGDFTEWRPLAMTQTESGRWEITLPIPVGVHQVNVRIDGGPWTVPGGTTRLAGDYGDDIGTVMVP